MYVLFHAIVMSQFLILLKLDNVFVGIKTTGKL